MGTYSGASRAGGSEQQLGTRLCDKAALSHSSHISASERLLAVPQKGFCGGVACLNLSRGHVARLSCNGVNCCELPLPPLAR